MKEGRERCVDAGSGAGNMRGEDTQRAMYDI